MIVALVALTNLALGVAYTGYGIMTAIEMRRDWRTFGFSHFGAAWSSCSAPSWPTARPWAAGPCRACASRPFSRPAP
jgi:hypothetical protein